MVAPAGHAFSRTADTVLRDVEAVRLRAQHLTFQQIADQLGMGNKGTAKRAVDRVLDRVQVEAADELRAAEDAVLLAARNELIKTLYAAHIVVSDGRVVRDDQGVALLDHGPKIAAARALQANSESRRKLHGIDAPTRSEITGENGGPIEVSVLDEFTRRLDELAAEFAADADQARRMALPGPAEADHAGR